MTVSSAAPSRFPARLNGADHGHLSDAVAAYVRDLIMSGQLRQGEFVRIDRLTGQLAMSATPVREGLMALRAEGFVNLAPRRGFVVAALTRQDVEDLFYVQAEFAGELAARAAVRATREELERVEEQQRKLEAWARAGDTVQIERANFQFHRTINLAARSEKLSWFLRSASRYAPRAFYGEIHGWQQSSLHDHHAIVQALTAGSARGAKASMSAHIIHAGELLAQHLQLNCFWDA